MTVWVGNKVWQAGTAACDGVVYLKGGMVDGACYVGEAVSDAAAWTWGRARSGWGYLRSKFD